MTSAPENPPPPLRNWLIAGGIAVGGVGVIALTLLLLPLKPAPGSMATAPGTQPATGADANTLSVAEAARIIERTVPRDCQTSIWRASAMADKLDPYYPMTVYIRKWVDEHLTQNPAIQKTAHYLKPETGAEQWSYTDEMGFPAQFLWVAAENYRATNPDGTQQHRYEASLQFCGYAFTGVTILDRVQGPNSKIAQVTFVKNYQPTPTANALLKSEFPLQNLVKPETTPQEVMLERLDATGWQIRRQY